MKGKYQNSHFHQLTDFIKQKDNYRTEDIK